MSDTMFEIKDKRLYALAGAALIFIVAASFSLGMAYQSTFPCDHNQPYEVNVSGGGVALMIPPGWGAYQIQDEYRKNYIRPTDQEG